VKLFEGLKYFLLSYIYGSKQLQSIPRYLQKVCSDLVLNA